MSADKTEIHPEHDAPTPQNIEDWSEEQLEAYNEASKSNLSASLDDEVALDEDDEAALDALAEGSVDTATVDLTGDITVEVKTHTNERIEQQLQTIDEHRDDLPRIRRDLISVMCWFIQDEQYAKRELWEEYARRYGTPKLSEQFFTVVEPALDQAQMRERVEKFRHE